LAKKIKNLFKFNKGNILVIGAIIIIAIVLVAGALLFTKIYNPPWNPFGLQSQQVLKKALETTSNNLKTYHSKGTIEIAMAKNETEENSGKLNLDVESIKIDFDSDTDQTNVDNLKDQVKFNFTIKMAGSAPIVLSAEGKLFKEDIYFKINEIPFPFNMIFSTGQMAIANKWIRYNGQEFMDILVDYAEKKSIDKLEIQKLKKQRDIAKQNAGMNEKFAQEIKKMLQEKKVIIPVKELKEENINGVKTYHYLAELNTEALKNFISQVYDLMEKQNLDSGAENMTEEKKAAREEMNVFLEKIGVIKFDIWIGKKDFYIYKIKGEKTISPQQFDVESEEKGNVKISFEYEQSKFNQPVVIEMPTDYENFGKLFTDFMDVYLKSMMVPAKKSVPVK